MQQENSNSNIQREIKQLQEELKFLKNLMPSDSALDGEKGDDDKRPKLFRNRPNPFTKYTIIKYFVPEETGRRISLFVVDEKGNQKMFWDYLQAGKHKLLIKDHGLTPGIYFYSLVIDGNIVDTYKMKIREAQ
ncbi:hypothetical protein QQ020_33545 [Fulvivirgaceae bacterium BMA12]|uniref:T9SS type A sorting domain-containing protein n=1 Tax=Agaribacillus aureus TaxID=3051825 RepID=A0ABT8LGW4_9BACT|nr:hypothetical protein [Fulvivirgaceae bacterium BMA12]